MLIASNFHDYYDSAMGLGIDKTVVYNRKTSKILKPNKTRQTPLHDLIEKLPPNRHHDSWWTKGGILLICGEAIPFVQFDHYLHGKFNFYSAHKAVDFALAKGIPFSSYWSFWRTHYVGNPKGIEHFFNDKAFSGLTRLHEIYNCPVILCERPDKEDKAITLNPNLKLLSYQTQKDPYTLFQSIYMFISGVLGTPPKEPRPISDEIKAANHGHDSPYSFRTMPGTKRSRRK
jgi:hypothetical protein